MKIEAAVQSLQELEKNYPKAMDGELNMCDNKIKKIKCPKSYKIDGFIEIECARS